MTKTELIKEAAAKAEVSQKDAGAVIDAALETIVACVADGDKLQIPGFGTFERRVRAEREGRNPQTGEAIRIAACNTPAFKAGKAFKEAVNK